MSGIHGQVLGHIARRGLEAASNIGTLPGQQKNVDQLVKQCHMYKDSLAKSPSNEVQTWHTFILLITAAIFIFLFASVRYTLGEVAASLAMIEQPNTIVVSESRVLDKGDSDALLEKEPLMVDEELVVIKEQPITGSLRKTLRHLHQIGGFRARWRGLGVSMVYHAMHGGLANVLAFIALGMSPVLQPIAYIMASVLLCRIHATWTHVMISQPSAQSWLRRIPRGRKVFKTLALPSFVFAVAQQLVIIMPLLVWFSWDSLIGMGDHAEPLWSPDAQQKLLALRVLTTISTAAGTAILILLPASVTLTRIEASLLPEDQETIVSFDRTLNGAAISAVNAGSVNTKSLFIEAWRSFDRASRLRLVKFYVKMALVQAHIIFTGALVLVGEVQLIGPEKLGLFVQSAVARLQLEMTTINGRH